jgi:hypothetical protein
MSPGDFAPKKKNTGMMIGIAAVVLVGLIAAIGAYLRGRSATPTVATTTAAPSGTELTTSTSAPTSAPIPSGKGLLLLSATPWGDVEKIVNADKQQEVPLTEDSRSTPARIELDPGKYTITLSGPDGQKNVDVQIQNGKPTKQRINLGTVNMDQLEKEIDQQ